MLNMFTSIMSNEFLLHTCYIYTACSVWAELQAWPAHSHITVATAQSIEMPAGQNLPEDISTATLDYIAARQMKSKKDSLQMYYRHIYGHHIER